MAAARSDHLWSTWNGCVPCGRHGPVPADFRLPANYRTAVEALERYLMHTGGIARGDVVVTMYTDLVDLFEQSAADGTPIRDIVGNDPVEFVEDFVANYADGSWIRKERDRLRTAIDQAAQEPGGSGS
ncbi:MAG: DUF1048 domain-containing protein [Micropruina sp.]|uniref:DUF1048 domain-containing protein n=1 Tax=Micropruina sp. TaxID=2737536 RepID=UPI0039E587B8